MTSVSELRWADRFTAPADSHRRHDCGGLLRVGNPTVIWEFTRVVVPQR